MSLCESFASITGADVSDGTITGADVSDGSLSGAELDLAAEPWHEVNFINGPEPAFKTADNCGFCFWKNYPDNNHNSAAFYRDPYGAVRLKGLVCSASAPPCSPGADLGAFDDIFTLPAGYRPERQIEFTTSSEGKFARLRIDPDGTVYADPPFNYGSLYLDNISFRCAPSGQDGCP